MNALDQLVGETCWHVSTGGVTSPSFVLVLGQKLPRDRPLKNKMQPASFRKNRGSIELLVWCSWRLQTSSSVLGSSDQDSAGLEHLKGLIGAQISDISCEPPAWDLEIGFFDGRKLVVFCDHVAPEASIAENWELWLPSLRITAGPGQQCEIEEDVTS